MNGWGSMLRERERRVGLIKYGVERVCWLMLIYAVMVVMMMMMVMSMLLCNGYIR